MAMDATIIFISEIIHNGDRTPYSGFIILCFDIYNILFYQL